GVDNRRITLIVIHARANSAVVVSLMEFVLVVLMEMEIKSIFQLRTLLINLQVSLTTPHTLSKSCVNFAGTILNIVTAVHLKASLSIQSQITALISIPRKICIIFNSKIFAVKILMEVKQAQPEEVQELLSKLVQDVKIISDELSEYINTPAWNRPLVYCDDDDDEDYTIAITPVLPTKEPDNSLIMEDEHLDTIPATESDEFIKSSVEILVPIPSESKGVPKVCDVPLCNNPTTLEAFKEHYETIIDSNNDYSSSDDDSYENIEYVNASPPDVEIVSLEVVEIVIPEVGGIDDDILLTIKDDILREKLLNVNLLIANIEALKDNLTQSSDFVINFNLEEISSGSTTTRSDYSLLDYEALYLDDDHIEEKSSGSTTTHADFSQYDSFIFDLSINPFPPTDRSDLYHEEFAGELAHIISLPDRMDIEILPMSMQLILWSKKRCVVISHSVEREEVDIIKKTENQAKMTKLSMEWKKTVQNQGQSPKMPKSESILKNTIECNLNPSDGPGKPNSISMKTVKTKWASI
ncbi:hypothetical protein Tco_0727916, partial [Tanacetum coccineum]